jgi:hypothetical protein
MKLEASMLTGISIAISVIVCGACILLWCVQNIIALADPD